MEPSPKSLRMQIAFFGRTNVGKSSLMNMIANQDISVVSDIPGTTTDIVEKPMELLPVGPVIFLDTAGLDDISELAEKRMVKTKKILYRADIAVLVCEPNKWTEYEEAAIKEFQSRDLPYIIAINKIDTESCSYNFNRRIVGITDKFFLCSSTDSHNRQGYIKEFINLIEKLKPPMTGIAVRLLGDLIPAAALVVFIVPIDNEAPKGRLIMPQVQAIRDTLDNNSVCLVTKESEYSTALKYLNRKPDLVVCDSQVVDIMVSETLPEVACTTFSILFSRFKGDLKEEVRAVRAIDNLKKEDKILIAEACSHHPNEDDIARVKIPRWLQEYLSQDVKIDYSVGRDFPDNLAEYKAIIHCGGCMLTRHEKMSRIKSAQQAGIPITNYGLVISLTKGVLERVLEPFKNEL